MARENTAGHEGRHGSAAQDGGEGQCQQLVQTLKKQMKVQGNSVFENEAEQKDVQQQFAIDVRPLSDRVIQQVVVAQGAGDQSSAHAQ